MLKEELQYERIPRERWKFDWTPPQKCPSDAQKQCYNQTNFHSTTYNIWKVCFASQIANSRNYINSFRFLEGRRKKGDCEVCKLLLTATFLSLWVEMPTAIWKCRILTGDASKICLQTLINASLIKGRCLPRLICLATQVLPIREQISLHI